jgi:hypothetical protein
MAFSGQLSWMSGSLDIPGDAAMSPPLTIHKGQ